MKTSTKALLLSALLFPGTGHFLLKRPGRACALLAIGILATGIYLQQAMQQAVVIADGIQSGSIALDAPAIENAINQTESQSMTLAGYILLTCWIVGIVDVWRLGRHLDRAVAAPPATAR